VRQRQTRSPSSSMAGVVGAVKGVVAAEMEEGVLLAGDADREDVVRVSKDILIESPFGDMFVVCGVSCHWILVVTSLIL
jgi:hypothetical protein